MSFLFTVTSSQQRNVKLTDLGLSKENNTADSFFIPPILSSPFGFTRILFTPSHSHLPFF